MENQPNNCKCCICELDFCQDNLLQDMKSNEYVCENCYIANFIEGADNQNAFGKLGKLAMRFKGKAWLEGLAGASFKHLLKDQIANRKK